MLARLVSLALGSAALVGAGVLLVPMTMQSSAPRQNVELPEPDVPPPVETVELRLPQPVAEPEGGERYTLTLDLARSDSIEQMLADLHVAQAEGRRASAALADLLGERKLASGEQINLVLQELPDSIAGPRLVALSVRPRPDREFVVSRQPGGSYSGEEKAFKLSPRFVRVNATLKSSILEDGTRSGAPAAAVNEFIRALSYEVDFQRELRANQRFFLLLEQLVTEDGTVANPGRLLAGELVLSSRVVSLVRFRPTDGADQFYNLKGESIARTFLRTPLSSWRITAESGMRQRPILGYGATHKGVDFGAPEGTPVLASSAGQVSFANSDGGHGLFVKIDHGSDVGTGYAHLSRLAPGIAPGTNVRQGQLIGFVGSTGLSTGPHLHYEFYRAGKPVDPLAEKLGVRPALTGVDLERFRGQVRDYIGQLKQAPSVGDGSMVLVPPTTPAQGTAPQRQAASEPTHTDYVARKSAPKKTR